MDYLLGTVAEKLGNLSPAWTYLALGFSAFLENVVPPVPGDTVVIYSAYLVGRGTLNWVPVYVSTCLGGTAGFVLMYYIGRSRGRRFLCGRGGGAFSPKHLARVEVWLARYGGWLILANRFLSGVRSVIALGAGIGGMGWRAVASLGLLSMAIWNAGLLVAGSALGRNWDQATTLLTQYNRAATMVVVTLVAGFALHWWRRSRG